MAPSRSDAAPGPEDRAADTGWGRPPLPATALFLLCVVQGVAGRPAPPGLRWVEALIVACGLIAVGWRPLLDLATGRALSAGRPGWTRRGALCLLILAVIPTLRGIVGGWSIDDLLRDLIPLGFLFLPLFLYPAMAAHGPRLTPWLTAGLTLEGVALALRWWRHADWGFGAVGVRVLADGGGYLLNAPSVLFAAVLLPVITLRLALAPDWRRRAAAIVTATAAAVCAAALLGAVHRLALGLMAAGGVIALVTEWRRRRGTGSARPHAAALLIAAVLAAATPFVGPAAGPVTGPAVDRLLDAFAHVAEKTRSAGENGRLAEAEAALAMAGSDPAAAMFGHGWGALIENPAVGGWRVSYTHSVVTYVVVKAGVVGLVALTVWLAGLAPAARRAWRRDPAIAFAMIAPLVTAFTLHTSYKYLDTGLFLVLLIAYSCFNSEKIHDCMRVRDV